MALLGAFVTPYFADHAGADQFLLAMVESIQRQSDPHWRLVIIDDHSPGSDVHPLLEHLCARDPERIHCIFMPEHVRQGACRNAGVQWAQRAGCDFVLFNDADDLSLPRRLEATRAIFDTTPDVGLVYTAFEVVDEFGGKVGRERLSEAIVQILDTFVTDTPCGADAWQRIAIDTGYTNLTSTTSVRTAEALKYPFYSMTAEDCNTWYRMSGGGVRFHFIKEPLTQYRIPSYVRGSQDRQRVGPSYSLEKMVSEVAGFLAAVQMALLRDEIDTQQAHELECGFYRRLARTLRAEGAIELADNVHERARSCGNRQRLLSSA